VLRAGAGDVTRRVAVTPKAWTPALVEERLRKAIALKAALAEGQLVDDPASRRSAENRSIIGGIGSAPGNDDVIDMSAEALSWLRWLDPDDAGIVTARFEGSPWKSICWRFGVSRPTADRRYRYALALIAWRLDGPGRSDRTPSLRSLLGMRRERDGQQVAG